MSADEDPTHVVDAALTTLVTHLHGRDATEVLASFGEDPVLLGSGATDQAVGRDELSVRVDELFARDGTLGFHWQQPAVRRSGDLIWFAADGTAEYTHGGGSESRPYRLSGVLRHDERGWRIELLHGSQTVTAD